MLACSVLLFSGLMLSSNYKTQQKTKKKQCSFHLCDSKNKTNKSPLGIKMGHFSFGNHASQDAKNLLLNLQQSSVSPTVVLKNKLPHCTVSQIPFKNIFEREISVGFKNRLSNTIWKSSAKDHFPISSKCVCMLVSVNCTYVFMHICEKDDLSQELSGLVRKCHLMILYNYQTIGAFWLLFLA